MTERLAQAQRQSEIVEWLRAERMVTVRQMARHYAVSGMTIHRDLDALEAAGFVRKVRGAAMLASPSDGESWPVCAMCGKRVPRRTAWVGTQKDGSRWQACCSHCGLLYLNHLEGAQLLLAADFLYGQMVNVYQAMFVLDSEITLCCVPSVLCFASAHDAECYCRGFGGAALDFATAVGALGKMHHHDPGPIAE